MRVTRLLLLLIGAGVTSGKMSNRTREQEFIQELLDSTTANTPPSDMMNNTVFVFTDLYQLVDVQEKQGLVHLKLWIYIYYQLPSLGWNQTEFNFEFINVKRGTFWNPDLVWYDVTDEVYSEPTGQALSWTGVVVAKTALMNVKVSCPFDVTFFPYDRHTCVFSIGQWLNSNSTYRVGQDRVYQPGSMMLNYFVESDQWHVIRLVTIQNGVRAFADFGYYDMVTYTLRLERKAQFFVFILMVPTVVLVLVSCLTFLLPVESGEKVSLGITILLAQTVGLLVLSEILPPSSENFPLFGVYVLVSILLISASILCTVFVIKLHYCTDREVPGCCRKLTRSWLMCVLWLKTLDGKEDSKTCEEMLARRQKEWSVLCELIDRVLLVVYSVLSISVTCGFLVRIAAS